MNDVSVDELDKAFDLWQSLAAKSSMIDFPFSSLALWRSILRRTRACVFDADIRLHV